MTANTPEADLDALLTQFAEQIAVKMGVSKDEHAVANIVRKIRWYRNKAGAVVIVKRGADRAVLATISPKKGDWSHLYPSWERVLANLEAKKVANNTTRASHDDLEMGAVPVLAESENA